MPPTPSCRFLAAILLASFLRARASETDFSQCLDDFRNGKYGTDGGVDFNGISVTNITEAVGLKYWFCKEHCGQGQEQFAWSNFSQQFSSWLLPWLALVSQIPFGAENRLDNLISGTHCLSSFRRWRSHLLISSHVDRGFTHSRCLLSCNYRHQLPMGPQNVQHGEIPQSEERRSCTR